MTTETEISAICARYGNDRHRMLDILLDIQTAHRCITPASMNHVAAVRDHH